MVRRRFVGYPLPVPRVHSFPLGWRLFGRVYRPRWYNGNEGKGFPVDQRHESAQELFHHSDGLASHEELDAAAVILKTILLRLPMVFALIVRLCSAAKSSAIC